MNNLKRKNIIKLSIIVFLFFILSGCGNRSQEAAGTNGTSTPSQQIPPSTTSTPSVSAGPQPACGDGRIGLIEECDINRAPSGCPEGGECINCLCKKKEIGENGLIPITPPVNEEPAENPPSAEEPGIVQPPALEPPAVTPPPATSPPAPVITPVSLPPAGSILTFKVSGDALCTSNGKPIIRMFSLTQCSHCQWIFPAFEAVIQEYSGRIVVHDWQLDADDDALTPEQETQIPVLEETIFQKYNPQISVPTFVFGCKYFRVGTAYEASGGLEAEKIEFRSVIDELLK